MTKQEAIKTLNNVMKHLIDKTQPIKEASAMCCALLNVRDFIHDNVEENVKMPNEDTQEIHFSWDGHVYQPPKYSFKKKEEKNK